MSNPTLSPYNLLPSILPHLYTWHCHPPVKAQNPESTNPNQMHFHPNHKFNTFNSKMYLKTFFLLVPNTTLLSLPQSLLFSCFLFPLIPSPPQSDCKSGPITPSFAKIPIVFQRTLKIKANGLWAIRPHTIWPQAVALLLIFHKSPTRASFSSLNPNLIPPLGTSIRCSLRQQHFSQISKGQVPLTFLISSQMSSRIGFPDHSIGSSLPVTTTTPYFISFITPDFLKLFLCLIHWLSLPPHHQNWNSRRTEISVSYAWHQNQGLNKYLTDR